MNFSVANFVRLVFGNKKRTEFFRPFYVILSDNYFEIRANVSLAIRSSSFVGIT